MNKTTKIVVAVAAVLIVVAIVIGIVLMVSKPQTNLDPITSGEDLTALVEKVYEGLEIEMPMVMSQMVDVADSDMVQYITGLTNTEDLEYVVASEPMMTSQAYSLVLVKVKDGVNADEIAKEMNENIDNRKWICVTAEKVYSTSSGNVVCLVMSNEEKAKAVYENFKTLAGTVGEEYVRTEEAIELPEDMLPGDDMLPAADPDNNTLTGEDTLPAADPDENTLTGEDTLPVEE